MKQGFKRLSDMLEHYPIKTIFLTIIVIIAMTVGAMRVELSTGNDTLVSTDSDVYKDYTLLENTFGTDPMILLYQSDEQVFTIETLNHMKEVAQIVEHDPVVSHTMSPVTIVEQMTTMQQVKAQAGFMQIADGLNKMGTELSNGMSGQQTPTPTTQMDPSQLTTQFNQIIDGVGKLQSGVEGVDTTTEQLLTELNSIKDQFPESNENQLSLEQLNQGLAKLGQVLDQLTPLSEGLSETETGLTQFSQQLDQLVETMNQSPTADLAAQMEKIQGLGSELINISDNMKNMQTHNNTLHPGLPSEAETLDYLAFEDDLIKPVFDGVVIDDNTMMMQIVFNGQSTNEEKSAVIDRVTTYVDDYETDQFDVTVTGKPVLDLSMRESMQESMQLMILMAVGLMVVVLLLIFKVKWRVFPLLVVLLATVATIGFMGWVNVPITMVSMAVFPILIGLGIDYAIQFQNRYHESLEEEE
jgi:predicted RND superfamily exporter protein